MNCKWWDQLQPHLFTLKYDKSFVLKVCFISILSFICRTLLRNIHIYFFTYERKFSSIKRSCLGEKGRHDILFIFFLFSSGKAFNRWYAPLYFIRDLHTIITTFYRQIWYKTTEISRLSKLSIPLTIEWFGFVNWAKCHCNLYLIDAGEIYSD